MVFFVYVNSGETVIKVETQNDANFIVEFANTIGAAETYDHYLDDQENEIYGIYREHDHILVVDSETIAFVRKKFEEELDEDALIELWDSLYY